MRKVLSPPERYDKIKKTKKIELYTLGPVVSFPEVGPFKIRVNSKIRINV
jgi:hypothetical protein